MNPSDLARAQQGDEHALENLIVENSGLIRSVCRRYFGLGVDGDDLYQLGCMGFIKAVKGFDTAFGTQFSTYAVPKIAGEIRRFLRDDGDIKVSRSVKERAAAIRSAQAKLLVSLGREPALSELSAATGISPEDIAAAIEATAPLESLQSELTEDGGKLEDFIADKSGEQELLEKVALKEAISSLGERERRVILLRYYRDFTQQKAADIMGISQVQISRIEKKAINELRQRLA